MKTYPLSIAPMLDWTDRHYRYFFRLISKHTLLYSEMVSTNAILRGNTNRLLGFDPKEKPLVLQLGGSNPKDLAECSKIGEDFGYDEINLNVGCPSDKVKSGHFGAALMAKPELVRDCLAAMKQAVSIPVSIKQRIGIDTYESYEYLHSFIATLTESKTDRYIIHARIAILNGLSPKENRKIPPIQYDTVYKLKKDFPNEIIEINGEIKSYKDISKHLEKTDGTMIGREAYENPYYYIQADNLLFHDNSPVKSRREIIEEMLEYSEIWYKKGIRPINIFRHLLGLFHGQTGAKIWKRAISNNRDWDNWTNMIQSACKELAKEVLDRHT